MGTNLAWSCIPRRSGRAVIPRAGTIDTPNWPPLFQWPPTLSQLVHPQWLAPGLDCSLVPSHWQAASPGILMPGRRYQGVSGLCDQVRVLPAMVISQGTCLYFSPCLPATQEFPCHGSRDCFTPLSRCKVQQRR